jgi:hypothetical protein
MSAGMADGSKVAEGIVAILGVIIGAGLSYVRDITGWLTKRKSFDIGATFELRKALRKINDKMSWLSRPIPEDLRKALAKGLVTVDGQDLYLGEVEEFKVPLRFWERNYVDILSLMSARRFQQFAEAFDLVQQFEAKFAEMKTAFLGSVGDPKKMARACYNELREIKKHLDESEAVILGNRHFRKVPQTKYLESAL